MKTLELNQMEKFKGGNVDGNGWICGAGIVIVLVGWEDPLAVIAGADLIYNEC